MQLIKLRNLRDNEIGGETRNSLFKAQKENEPQRSKSKQRTAPRD